MSGDVDFFDAAAASGAGRSALLLAAADAADSLGNFQGSGGTRAADDGAIALRALAQDEIVFSSQPEVYPIDVDAALKSAQLPPGVSAASFAAGHKYFLVRFPFDVQPAGPWNFHELKVRIEFTCSDGERRPKVQGLFPSTRYQDLLKADASLEIKVTPSAELSANTGALAFVAAPLTASAKAGIDGKLNATAGLSVGPFHVDWKRAIVKTSQPGLEWVWWQVGGADLRRGDSPPFMVILQVPDHATNLTAVGQVQATRYYNLIRNAFQNITNWPKVYREFVEAGAPYVAGPLTWDLSKDVSGAH